MGLPLSYNLTQQVVLFPLTISYRQPLAIVFTLLEYFSPSSQSFATIV